jgi:hypothetical protein
MFKLEVAVMMNRQWLKREGHDDRPKLMATSLILLGARFLLEFDTRNNT